MENWYIFGLSMDKRNITFKKRECHQHITHNVKDKNIVCKKSLCHKSSRCFRASITSPSSSPNEPSIRSELMPAPHKDTLALSGAAEGE